MKNWMRILTIFACLGYAGSTLAQELQVYEGPDVTPEHGISFQQEQKKLVMPFVGEDEEEGILELFVAKNKFNAKQGEDSPVANELNRISPAAGVQFRLEF